MIFLFLYIEYFKHFHDSLILYYVQKLAFEFENLGLNRSE
jgi:hypothetical protein